MSPPKCSLLVVDDEPYILPTLAALLGDDYEVVTADSAAAAEEVFRARPIDIILTDQRMPRRTGVQLLEWVRDHSPRTVRLLMTGYAELEDAVEAINRGHVYYYLPKPWRVEELQQVLRNAAEKFELERSRDHLMRELQKLNAELEERVCERTRALESANKLLQSRSTEVEQANQMLQMRTRELERLILLDPLTGLFNRRALEGLALAEVRRHNRYNNPLSLGIVDVDHFKNINTEHDLPGGDEALRGLARVLTSSLREVDSVGRLGGEEFLIIARETNAEGAASLAERVRATVAASPLEYRGRPIQLTVSLGVVVAEAGTQVEFTTLYQEAAAALTEAKRSGRNCFIIRRIHPPTE